MGHWKSIVQTYWAITVNSGDEKEFKYLSAGRYARFNLALSS